MSKTELQGTELHHEISDKTGASSAKKRKNLQLQWNDTTCTQRHWREVKSEVWCDGVGKYPVIHQIKTKLFCSDRSQIFVIRRIVEWKKDHKNEKDAGFRDFLYKPAWEKSILWDEKLCLPFKGKKGLQKVTEATETYFLPMLYL